MELLTEAISDQLKAQWRKTGEISDDEVTVHLKIFDPYSAVTWWITEQNPQNPDELFGLCYIFEQEWGYIFLSELQTDKGPLGIGLERDLYWRPITVKQLKGGKPA